MAESTVSVFFPVVPFEPRASEQLSFEQLMGRFIVHEREEGAFLATYRDIAHKYQNPLVRFLLQLIISDEEKHHDVVRAITETMSADLSWRSGKTPLPTGDPITVEEKESLQSLTAAFIEMEKEGIKEYKALLKPSRNDYGGLLTLLIRTIIHDSEKHVMILEFIERKLRER